MSLRAHVEPCQREAEPAIHHSVPASCHRTPAVRAPHRQHVYPCPLRTPRQEGEALALLLSSDSSTPPPPGWMREIKTEKEARRAQLSQNASVFKSGAATLNPGRPEEGEQGSPGAQAAMLKANGASFYSHVILQSRTDYLLPS